MVTLYANQVHSSAKKGLAPRNYSCKRSEMMSYTRKQSHVLTRKFNTYIKSLCIHLGSAQLIIYISNVIISKKYSSLIFKLSQPWQYDYKRMITGFYTSRI